MVTGTTVRTPYQIRLELVRDTVTMYSTLDDDAAGELAEHVLHALNCIPEGALSSAAVDFRPERRRPSPTLSRMNAGSRSSRTDANVSMIEVFSCAVSFPALMNVSVFWGQRQNRDR